jgi:hypothetical protein
VFYLLCGPVPLSIYTSPFLTWLPDTNRRSTTPLERWKWTPHAYSWGYQLWTPSRTRISDLQARSRKKNIQFPKFLIYFAGSDHVSLRRRRTTNANSNSNELTTHRTAPLHRSSIHTITTYGKFNMIATDHRVSHLIYNSTSTVVVPVAVAVTNKN